MKITLQSAQKAQLKKTLFLTALYAAVLAIIACLLGLSELRAIVADFYHNYTGAIFCWGVPLLLAGSVLLLVGACMKERRARRQTRAVTQLALNESGASLIDADGTPQAYFPYQSASLRMTAQTGVKANNSGAAPCVGEISFCFSLEGQEETIFHNALFPMRFLYRVLPYAKRFREFSFQARPLHTEEPFLRAAQIVQSRVDDFIAYGVALSVITQRRAVLMYLGTLCLIPGILGVVCLWYTDVRRLNLLWPGIFVLAGLALLRMARADKRRERLLEERKNQEFPEHTKR